jgi:membrane protease YdiL (CAAX protease family)
VSEPQPTLPTPLGAASLTLFAWAITLFGTALASEAQGAIALAIGLCLGFGGVGTMAARSVPPPSDLRLGLHGFPLRFLAPLLLIAPSIVLASEIDNWMPALLPPLPAGDDAAEAVANPEIAQLETLEAVITMVLLRPVLEEFFFRGVIQQGLVAHLGALGGVLQTALLSGVAAGGLFLVLVPSVAASAAAQAAFMALLYGVLRYTSGSLLTTILASIGYGLLGVAATQLGVDIPGFTTGREVHTPLWLLLPSALSVVAGVALALRWRIPGGAIPSAPPPAQSSIT